MELRKKVFSFSHLSQIFENHLGEILFELCGTGSADGLERRNIRLHLKKAVNPITLFYYCFSFSSKYLGSALKVKEPRVAKNTANNKILSNEGRNPMSA